MRSTNLHGVPLHELQPQNIAGRCRPMARPSSTRLPNPVLLVAPDGRIVDANMAAESFFEISTQFLRRQSLKELVPFGSPLLALIDQVRIERLAGQRVQGRSGHAADRRRPPGGPSRRAAHRAARPYRRDAAGAHHRRQDGPAIDASKRGAFGDRAGRDAGA